MISDQTNLLQILQVSIYSKLLNTIFTDVKLENHHYLVCFIFFILFNVLRSETIKTCIENYINRCDSNESIITIPYHRRVLTTTSFGSPKECVQIRYSNRFHALNHYLSKHSSGNIFQMVEIMKRDYKSDYYDNEIIDYVLLPVHNQKIEICKKDNIFFEIMIEQDKRDDDDKKDKNRYQNINAKNYTYRISKSGKHNYDILYSFIENCVKEFEDETINKKQQRTFEFMKSEKDEDDKMRLSFREYTFKSNKFLDKNIFFEGKDKFIEYIDKFKNSRDFENIKSKHELEYEDSGITFKAGILLHGSPGCGKSCTIRGILNRTGRHGVIVRWSLIKTCNEFTSIFRSAINNIKYDLKDLCFIFEDFDANKDQVLKKRSDITGPLKIDTDSDDDDETNLENVIKKTNKQNSKTLQTVLESISKNSDDLTLECVLNTIDGIVELHDAMYIFTTNMKISKIDTAFLRPGRIDYVLEFKLATVITIREMLSYKYRTIIDDFTPYDSYFNKMKDEKISPAEVQNIYLKYPPDKIEACLQELVDRCN